MEMIDLRYLGIVKKETIIGMVVIKSGFTCVPKINKLQIKNYKFNNTIYDILCQKYIIYICNL